MTRLKETDLFPELRSLQRKAYRALPLQGRILLRCNAALGSPEALRALQFEGVIGERTDVREAYDAILGRL